MPRAPKKFLDADKLEINPAYRDWKRAQKAEMAEMALAGYGPGAYETFYPEDYGKALSEEGGWIRVTDVPNTNLGWDVPLLSMWYAFPDPSNSGAVLGLRPMRARILTPGGNLWLWPHEYSVVENISEWVGMEPDCILHRLGGEPVLDEDHMFYLQQRGITAHDAALMLVGEMHDQTFGWFELDQYYVDIFGGVGQPLWKHIAYHPRETAEKGS